MVLDGNAGNDRFQFGQVYGSKRDILQTGGSLEPEDLFPAGYQAVPTVRGWLSRGPSNPVIAAGGEGDDTFSLYANAAPLLLRGGPGTNTFTTRTFLFARTTGNCSPDVNDTTCEFVWRDRLARIVQPLRPEARVASVPATVVDADLSGVVEPLWVALLLPGERNEPLFDPGDQYVAPPPIGITKAVSLSQTGPFVTSLTTWEGSTVWYRITVTNLGPLELTGVTLTDDLVDLGTVGCVVPTSLAAGTPFECVYSASVVRGVRTNTATADADETTPVTDSATVTGLRPPILGIAKAVRSATTDYTTDLVVPVGTAVTWRITVTNGGDVGLTGLALTDSRTDLVAAGCVVPASLAAGESYTCTYAGTAAPGTVENTATATAAGTPPATASARVTGLPVVPPPQPEGLSLTKGVRADPSQPYTSSVTVVAGALVYFAITVTNTGPTTLTGITLADDHADLATCTIPDELAPDKSFTCTYTAIAAEGTVINTATAGSAHTIPVRDSATVTGTTVAPPPIGITKAVSLSQTGPFVTSLTTWEGSTVWYRISVTNLGPLELTGVTLTDDLVDLGTVGCVVPTSLAAGTPFECVYSASVVRGVRTNTATADADQTTPVTDSATVTGLRPPILGIAKAVRSATTDYTTDSSSCRSGRPSPGGSP